MLSARHKRGQARRDHKRGQALVELLPSLVIFFMVLSAGLAYFRIMRAATIRQEVVRNLAFAKIDNMGTLTTPGVQAGGGIFFGNFLGEQAIVRANDNSFVSADSACFVVNPRQVREAFEPTRIFGIGIIDAPVEVTSYAVVYRFPASRCP